MNATTAIPFLSDAWLAAAGAAFADLPVCPDSAVRFGFTVTDPPPGVVGEFGLVLDLDSGGIRLDRDADSGNPTLRLSYHDAAAFLLGSALDRVRVFESGRTELTGNLTHVFFADRTLQQDTGGLLARLRRRTGGLPDGLGDIGWTGRNSFVDTPAEERAAADAAADELPRAVAALRSEVGDSAPGAQVYVSRDGRVLADFALGTARPGVAFTRRSPTLWYCCAKPLGSLAVGQLWERGLLDPFAPVCGYLPDFTGQGREELTLAQVMTHTAAVPTGLDPVHGALYASDARHRALVRELAVPADPRPGTRVNYSQWWGWLLLAEVLEAVDGRCYEQYVEEEILRPCGISGTTRVRLTAEEFGDVGETLPLVYISARGRPAQPTYWFSSEAATTCRLPGVNTRGPMADLGRFFEVLLAGGRAPGGRIAAPTTIAALTARHRSGLRDAFGNADWGLGLRLECGHLDPSLTSFSRFSSPRSYGHDGLWTAVAFADPDAGLVVALHLNGKTHHDQHRARLTAICDAIYEDLGLC
ncbi:hypothetical protein GCM10025787_44950 [Saccharopolyspora rosea]